MKKYLFLILALFMFAGVANATDIPTGVEPKNHPVVWTETVYNGSGSTITSATVVEWDFDTSDSTYNHFDDMCAWIKSEATAGSPWTAGVTVLGRDIANGNYGQIVIKGPAVCRIGSTVTAGDCVEGNGSASVQPHDGAAVDEGTLGVAIKAEGADANGYSGLAIIYVNPVQYDKD